MRQSLVRLHRYFGVITALFLFMSGLTGAIIAWDHELDGMINPAFFHARTDGPALPSTEIARRIEAADPRVQVSYLPLGAEAGHTLQMMVMPRNDPATGKPFAVDYNQVAVDPATGEIQGRREWGAISLAPLNLIPFIYKLHYTLHLPLVGGIETGVWLMGIIGMIWLVDSVIALVLSFPSVKAWKKSFAFRVKRGGYALTFDLHRSGGVWIWGLLVIIATTSVGLNLPQQVVRPVVSMFSTLTPEPFGNPALMRAPAAGEKAVTREDVFALAQNASRIQHLKQPGAIWHVEDMHAWGVGFFGPGKDHGDAPLGNAWLFWDATGKPLGATIPGQGSAGDLFMQLQFPLHSGRILGTFGRAMMSVLGLMVATLSITGLIIWIRKMNARRTATRRPAPMKNGPASRGAA